MEKEFEIHTLCGTKKAIETAMEKFKPSQISSIYGIPVKIADWLPPDRIMIVNSSGKITMITNCRPSEDG